MIAALLHEQRRTGEEFEYYRRGLNFDENDPVIRGRINARVLPQQVIIDAYDDLLNLQLGSRRDERIRRRSFDLAASPKPNIRRKAARENVNDMNQASADFGQLKRTWGGQINCQ